MTGLLHPKSSEVAYVFRLILVAHLGHGMFHPVASLFFSESVCGRGLEAPEVRDLRGKVGYILS